MKRHDQRSTTHELASLEVADWRGVATWVCSCGRTRVTLRRNEGDDMEKKARTSFAAHVKKVTGGTR